MATVLYPQQNNGLSQIASIANMIRGFQQLSEQKDQNALRRGQNIDDQKFTNSLRGNVENVIAEKQRALPPDQTISSPQRIIADSSQAVRKGQRNYTRAQNFLDNRKLAPEEDAFLGGIDSFEKKLSDLNINPEEAKLLYKQREEALKRKALAEAPVVKDVADAQYRGDDVRKVPGFKRTIQDGRDTKDTRRSNRAIDLLSMKKEKHDVAQAELTDIKKRNVKEFSGDADALYNNTRSLANEMIDYHVEGWRNSSGAARKKHGREAARIYKDLYNQYGTYDNYFKWNKRSEMYRPAYWHRTVFGDGGSGGKPNSMIIGTLGLQNLPYGTSTRDSLGKLHDILTKGPNPSPKLLNVSRTAFMDKYESDVAKAGTRPDKFSEEKKINAEIEAIDTKARNNAFAGLRAGGVNFGGDQKTLESQKFVFFEDPATGKSVIAKLIKGRMAVYGLSGKPTGKVLKKGLNAGEYTLNGRLLEED